MPVGLLAQFKEALLEQGFKEFSEVSHTKNFQLSQPNAGCLMKAKGFDPTSVDSYNKEFGLMEGRPEAKGLATHHPLYDSVAAAVCYMHLLQ